LLVDAIIYCCRLLVCLEIFYPYSETRPGQAFISEKIVKSYYEGRDIVVEAPAGIGKTAAALAAAYYLGYKEAIGTVYAVRTKREVERVLAESLPFSEHYSSKAAGLLAMTDGCLLRHQEKFVVQDDLLPVYCSTNINLHRCSFFERTHGLPPGASNPGSLAGLVRLGQTFRICPYMLARFMAMEAQVIVTTYTHILEKTLRDSLTSRRKDWKRWMLICDEAHNLPEIVYDAFTTEISLKELESAYHESVVRGYGPLSFLASKLLGLVKTCRLQEEDETVLEPRDLFTGRLHSTLSLLESSVRREPVLFDPIQRSSSVFMLRLVQFAKTLAEVIGRGHARLFISRKSGVVRLKVSSMDPMEHVSLDGFVTRVYLSATMPGFGFQKLERVSIDLDQTKRSCTTLVDTTVTTAFSQRSPKMFERIASGVENVRRLLKGPLVVFLPSYALMASLIEKVEELHEGGELLFESPTMSVRQQESLLDSLLSAGDSTLFAVMGGKFAEGEDFRAGSLSFVVVIGLPLPPPSLELKERLRFLSSKAGAVTAYQELVLGVSVNKVVQAVGRLFRRYPQSGTVLLMDRRFGWNGVQQLLPLWMRSSLSYVTASDANSISRFIQRPA
jgi:DNA excision repair protein ERCC-2